MVDSIHSSAHEYSQKVQRAENKRKHELGEVRKSYEGRLLAKERASKEKEESLTKAYRLDLSQLTSAHDEKADLNASDINKKIQMMNAKNNKEKQEMITKNNEILERLSQRFRLKKDQLQKSYETIIKSKDHEIREIKKQNKYKLSYQEKKHKRSIEKINDDLDDKLKQIRKRHRREIQRQQRSMI